MANHRSIHTPQRFEGESQSNYRERRDESRRIVKRLTTVQSGTETSREALRNAQRKSGSMKRIAGRFGRGLMNAITRKQGERLGTTV